MIPQDERLEGQEDLVRRGIHVDSQSILVVVNLRKLPGKFVIALFVVLQQNMSSMPWSVQLPFAYVL